MLLRDITPIKGQAGSERLVVLVHGWWGKNPLFSIRDVHNTILEELPDADLLAPKYPDSVTSNADPVEICEQLADVIEMALDSREREGGTYRDIILIGFSLGSLMVRKAYVIGRDGKSEASPNDVGTNYRWVDRVSRIILLAGVNRGWTMNPKPKHTAWWLFVTYHFFKLLTKLLPICKLSRDYYRGRPFVENLRIRWHQLEREKPLPPTIQLYGREEDVVSREDMVDIRYCSTFFFILVPGTGHLNAANFHQLPLGPQRRACFLRALKDPVSTLKGLPPVRPVDEDSEEKEKLVGDENQDVTDVVFVIHGIRDYGGWTKKMGDRIADIARSNRLRVAFETPRYKFFPMLGFLLGKSRQRNVTWFVDKYAIALARHPLARFHFIGHSNGTYLLADALLRYAPMHFNRVAFAGSVVRRGYPWDAIVEQKRVECVRNDMAADDWVVAVFPRFFEQVWELTEGNISLGDVGSAGVFGFEENAGQQHEVLIRGDHGAAIGEKNHESLARWILGVDKSIVLDEGIHLADHVSPLVVWLSRLSILLCTALLGIVVALVIGLIWLGHPWMALIAAALILLLLNIL